MLTEVKEYLKITWDDEDEYIQGFIDRGMANLNELTGTELDYNKNSQAKSLLLDYCRYGYNNALEYFEENFHKEIVRLQIKVAVIDYDIRQKEENEHSQPDL